MNHFDDLDAPDLRPIAERLQRSRPELSALELDATKRRIMARAATPARTRGTKGSVMKSRLAILGMVVLGMLFSTAGVGLAVDGLTRDASTAQYGPGTNGGGGGGGNVGGETNNGGGGGVAGEESGLQPTRQVEAGATGGDELPFTGFLAIPVLLGGVALLSTGLVLRRRSLRDDG